MAIRFVAAIGFEFYRMHRSAQRHTVWSACNDNHAITLIGNEDNAAPKLVGMLGYANPSAVDERTPSAASPALFN